MNDNEQNLENQPEQNPKKSKRRILWTVVIVLLSLVAAAAIAVCVYWNSMPNLLGDADETVVTLSQEEIDALVGTTEETDPTETTSPDETWPVVRTNKKLTNIMLVGQNWREDEQNKLSDTMILCSINRETKTMTMVSFLRDLYIKLPNYAGHSCGRNRINCCYALGSTWKRSSEGGMEMLAQCIEENFGVHVDYTIEVSFTTFMAIIDGFGGVEIDVTEEEAKYMTEYIGYVEEIQPGLQYLDGNEALAYARIRKIDGDRQRAERQRNVITSLLNRCRSLTLTELHNAAEYCLPFIITDMTNLEITNYMWELIPMIKDIKLQSLTIPVDNETLPGSMWGKMIDLYGYPSSVIECNTSLNGKYLREALGVEEVEE